jgi:hypothetical protein
MTVKIPPYSIGRYFSFFIIAGLATAFGGYMVMEGSSAEVTTLEKQGAPGAVIIFIADPHLRMSNLDYTKKVIDNINSLHPSLPKRRRLYNPGGLAHYRCPGICRAW